MKIQLASTFVAAALAVSAVERPVVSGVSLVQDPDSHMATITYDLAGSDAIVIVDVVTNGVSIGPVQGLVGDCNSVVAAGSGKKVYWTPGRYWPEGGLLENGSLSARVTAYPTNSPPDYMVVDLCGVKTSRYFKDEASLPGGIGDSSYRDSLMVFRKIKAANATFRLGSKKQEPNREEYYETPCYVSFSNDFYLAVFPCTQGQYQRICDANATFATKYPNSSTYKDADDAYLCPVDYVNAYVLRGCYSAAMSPSDYSSSDGAWFFLSAMRTLTGIPTITIPTVAEWEFACRAGSGDTLYEGTNVSALAWHSGNSGGRLHPVGLKKPNAFGLYDMLGNVNEICLDSARQPYDTTQTVSPFNRSGGHGAFNECRGGSYLTAESNVRCSARFVLNSSHNQNYFDNCEGPGFRLKVALP